MKYIFYLLFYGFGLTGLFGLLASWLDRKTTARVQYRVGPPLLQPLTDLVKLFGKETLIPQGASRLTFLTAPILGLAAVGTVATLFWLNSIHSGESFVGDLIVAVYLLTIPSLSIMLGGFASANPLASLGASREMKLILSYELPFLLAIMVPVIQANFSLRLNEIINFQAENGLIAGSWSGFLGLSVAVVCMQAKLALVPFDIAEAETEIVSGPLIEYSGTPLALYRLMKNMLLFTLPFLLIILFLGGIRFKGINLLFSGLKYLGLLVIITVIRNTNPRLRIDQALRFFWGPLTIIAILAVVLALKGY